MLRTYFGRMKKPYDVLISLHEDPERTTFYLYDYGNGRESRLIHRIFRIVQNHRIAHYTGIDDPTLGVMVTGGYVRVARNDRTPSLEDFLFRNRKAKRGVTIEIPGKLGLARRTELVANIVRGILAEV